MICTKNDLKWIIRQVWDTKSTTWCSSSISHDVICIPGTARYVIRNHPHDVFYAETERPRVKKSRRHDIMNESSWHDRSPMICTENNTRNCQVCDTKSTTWCSWSISHDVICIPRTTRYVVRNQAETAEDAESTSDHQRIQQYAIFRFNYWRRNDMYTTNCKVCDTIWSINRRRCQKHERTSTYTAVRYFPV